MTDLDTARLQGYLTGQGIDVQGALRWSVITGGRSNLTYRVGDDVHSWVLRRPPAAGLTPSAHDMGREYRVVDALQGSAVPVARTVVNCTDVSVIGAPFTLVEFVPGRVLRVQADLDGLSDAHLEAVHHELIRVLVALHAVSYEQVGLGEFGRPDGFFERQVRRWRQQWDHVATRELPDIERLYQALSDGPPVQGRAGIVHGDYRIDNTLLDPTGAQILALVDWEMSTLGDPLTDVAVMCAYQHPDFDFIVGEPAASTSTRWPKIDSLVQDYATQSGFDLADFDRYLGLAYFKVAVIAEGIASRHLAGVGSGDGYATAAQAVPGLVAAGLAILGPRR